MRLYGAHWFLASFLLLTACGGGSDSSPTSTPTDTSPDNSESEAPESEEEIQYTVTISTITDGGESEVSTREANESEVLELDLTPGGDLAVLAASGCGGSLENVGSNLFTTEPISSDCQVDVEVGVAGQPPELSLRSLPGKVEVEWSGASRADIFWSTDSECDWRNYASCGSGGAKIGLIDSPATLDVLQGDLQTGQSYFFVSQTPAGVSEPKGARALRLTPPAAGALLTHNGTLYVASTDRHAGQSEDGRTVSAKLSLSLFDWEREELVGALPNVSGSIHAAAADSDGWIIAGDFSAVGGVSRKQIARLTAQGAVDRQWELPIKGGTVYALKKVGDILVIGGDFTEVDGQARQTLALFDLDSGELMGPLAGAGQPDMEQLGQVDHEGELLYLSGKGPGESGSHFVAGYDISQSEWLWSLALDGYVEALWVDDGSAYFAGDFTKVDEMAREKVAAIDSQGQVRDWYPELDNNADPSSDPAVDQLWAVAQGVVYLEVSDMGSSYRAAFSGETGESVAGLLDQMRFAHYFSDSALGTLAIGDMESADEQPRGIFNMSAGEFLPAPAQFESWPRIDPWNLTDAVAAGESTLLLAGPMEWHVEPSGNLLAVDPATGVPTGWDADIGSLFPLDTAVHGTTLYVAGHENSEAALRAVDLTTGEKVSTELEVMGSRINALHLEGDRLYLAGDFYQVDGETRQNLAAYDLAGEQLLEWDPTAPAGPVSDMVVDETHIYIGGDFSQVDNEPRQGLARLELETGALSGWQVNDELPEGPYVSSLELHEDRLAVGFNTTGFDGDTLLEVFDLEAGQTVDIGSHPDTLSGAVWDLELQEDHLYVGGAFNPESLAQDDCCFNAMRIDLTQNNYELVGQPSGTVNSLALDESRLYLGGEFWVRPYSSHAPILTAFDPVTLKPVW